MANMKQVNVAIKNRFPNLDIEAVRGEGYIYFDGEDGFDKIESLYMNPPTTPTQIMIDHVIQQILSEQG